jgi:Tfp pilus assembly protein PilE
MKRGICSRLTTTPAVGGHPASRLKAFTVIDLAVLVAILAVLAILLLPALAATQDRNSRAMCQSNLRQIGIAMTAYAADNNDTVFPARAGVPITITGPSASAAKQLGLSTNLSGNNIWTCPSRPGLPVYEPSASPPQWVIGYQYYGGITTWNTALGPYPSRSPVKLSQSRPYWTLAADPLIKMGTVWADQAVPKTDPRYIIYTNIPPHRVTDTTTAQGGNQVFCDGSVQWIEIEKMYRLHSWAGVYGTTYLHFYQDPVDFPATLKSALPALAAQP